MKTQSVDVRWHLENDPPQIVAEIFRGNLKLPFKGSVTRSQLDAFFYCARVFSMDNKRQDILCRFKTYRSSSSSALRAVAGLLMQLATGQWEG